MKITRKQVVVVAALVAALAITSAYAQQPSTPDSVKTRIGTLNFERGYPTAETAQKLYDEMDFQRAVQAFPVGLSRRFVRNPSGSASSGIWGPISTI